METNYQELTSKLNPKYLKLNEPLSLHSTVGIGGPADIWYEAQSTPEFVEAINLARRLNIPVTILGRGSNVLISDDGIRGLVLKNGSKNIIVGQEVPVQETQELEDEMQKIEYRWASDNQKGTFKYEFKDLDYDESSSPRVEVKIDSGVDMAFAINFLINKGITGLQWYARIPGNLGGWIYNNVHGGTHFINELIKSVDVLSENGAVITLKASDLNFGYDESRFHNTKEIILSATLNLYMGDKEKAKYVAIEWAKRKAIQPHRSLGSVFKNISNEDKQRLDYPTTAIGYIVEHVSKLTGLRVGDAGISPAHHNFIENFGNATANDYLQVIRTIQAKVLTDTGLRIHPEIFFLGFKDEEIKDIL